MKRAVLSLGSNLLQREKYLEDAQILLKQKVGTLVRASQVYETPSWGFDSFPFLNQVVVIDTQLSVQELLAATLEIESLLGRTQKSSRDQDGHPVYHDRTIDIDILLYGDEQIESEELTVPHPRIAERAFVLIPLQELFGSQVVPPFKTSFQDMLNLLNKAE